MNKEINSMVGARMSPATEAIESDLVLSHLGKIIASNEFLGANRLQEFLNYIVKEKLEGRDKQIRAKTILQDVYNRIVDGRTETESVVRVDAGRLRRRLAMYYNDSGREDQVRIEIPTGGYAPVFGVAKSATNVNSADETRKFTKPEVLLKLLIGFSLLLLITVGFLSWMLLNSRLDGTGNPDAKIAVNQADENLNIEAKRQAMFDKSPTSLQAFDFAKRARGLIFPPTDLTRLKSALSLFRRAIDLDENYSGGYAGAAQVLAFMELFKPLGSDIEFLSEAKTMAATAQDLESTNTWVQSAVAWVAFVGGNYEKALKYGRRSILLDNTDSHNRDFNGMILVFSGELENSINLVSPHLNDINEYKWDIDRNIYAVASFHLGNYKDAIQTLEEITTKGGASGVLTLSYLAAAHHASGNQEQAGELIERIKKTWPAFKPETFFPRLFRHNKYADQIILTLEQAGW
jgi:tetratricopeptide (TPR) repeat protein